MPSWWLAVSMAVLVFAGASSPWVAQRMPRFFFPALAIAGAVLVCLSLGRSLMRLVRRTRGEGRVHVVAVVLNVVAPVVLVVLPVARLVTIATSSGVPRILAGFRDWRGAEGYPSLRLHSGIDVAGHIGDDVLAAADGRVAAARDNGDCGLMVVVDHDPLGYRTIYCHQSAIGVQRGDIVRRGQRIGALGTTGQRAWPGYEHVHLSLRRGGVLEDPAPKIVGCFDPTKAYPADRLVLTYPVRC